MNFLSLAEDNEMLEKDWKLIKNNQKHILLVAIMLNRKLYSHNEHWTIH